MATKLKHDATESAAAIIYQFYVAVDRCFDLVSEEKVYIEKYGDITISEREQIEVKQYSDKLTDLHENIWKTISNWLQEGFDQGVYKDLILFTTQEYGKNSSFKDWNDKVLDEKLAILEKIAKAYTEKKKKSADTEALLKKVLSDTTKEKLKDILTKFKIYDSSPKDYEYFNYLKEKHGKGVLTGKREAFINSLMGYLAAPKDSSASGWEVAYEDFSQQVESLTSQFSSATKIFPKKYLNNKPSSDEIAEKASHLFVKKIEEIHYEEVKEKAISDYINTNKTILDELSHYATSRSQYDAYEDELYNFYKPQYRIFSRKADSSNVFNMSKDLYDQIIGSKAQIFTTFIDTPISFRNGMIHNMADDEEKDIRWKLEVKDDE